MKPNHRHERERRMQAAEKAPSMTAPPPSSTYGQKLRTPRARSSHATQDAAPTSRPASSGEIVPAG